MKKVLLFILVLGVHQGVLAQGKGLQKKKSVIGVSFTMHDFATVAAYQKSSLSQILDAGTWAKTRDMNPGFAISYVSGISEKLDVMVRMGMTSLAYPRTGAAANVTSVNRTMIESDVSFQAKLLSDKHLVSPYASLGVGASVWNGYYAAYAPAGLGLQVNLFDEVYMNVQSQFRFAVSSNATNHVFYSIGFGAPLGK